MSEYGASLQSNIMELVKCELILYINLSQKQTIYLHNILDVENSKNHRLHLEELIQRGELEQAKV